MSEAPSFIVIGGAQDGCFYVRQLLRAERAGRLNFTRIHVIDRDPGCRASSLGHERVRLELAHWDDWLDAHLLDFGPEDQFVPYHWAPHLLLGWLERAGRRAGLEIERGEPLPALGLPFESDARDGSRALSYASWPCPPTCIEPALCPHTRGPRDWSLATELRAATSLAEERWLFGCLHYAYGVGTIPLTQILAARERLLNGAEHPRQVLVGTASHCHGLAARLVVRPRASAPT